MRYRVFLVIGLLVVLSCKTQEQQHYDLVLLNGNVIDLVSGNLQKKDIFIKQNRIVKITTKSVESEIEASKIIDISDKYILPGYWDNHVHFRGGDSLISANKDFLKLFVMNGVTTVRDAGGDLTKHIIRWNREIKKGNIVGPTILTSGPKIDGPNATWAGSLVVENQQDISEALDSLEALKVDFVKIYDSRISGEMYLETVREATNRDLITSGHMPFSVTLNDNINAGIGAIEHLYYVLKGCSSQENEITEAIRKKDYGFWQSMDKLIASYDDKVAQETFNQLKANNVYVVPTLHIGNVLSYLDTIDHSSDAYLSLMPEGIIDTYEGRIRSALNASEKYKEGRKALNTTFIDLTNALNKAGVKLLAGSDCGAYNSYIYPGVSLHYELEALVKSGLSPLEALRTSAYNGSNFLNKDKEYGSIETGKIADIVVLNANPLTNIKDTRNIEFVVKNNEVFNPKDIAKDIECNNCLMK